MAANFLGEAQARPRGREEAAKIFELGKRTGEAEKIFGPCQGVGVAANFPSGARG